MLKFRILYVCSLSCYLTQHIQINSLFVSQTIPISIYVQSICLYFYLFNTHLFRFLFLYLLIGFPAGLPGWPGVAGRGRQSGRIHRLRRVYRGHHQEECPEQQARGRRRRNVVLIISRIYHRDLPFVIVKIPLWYRSDFPLTMPHFRQEIILRRLSQCHLYSKIIMIARDNVNKSSYDYVIIAVILSTQCYRRDSPVTISSWSS